MASYFEEDITFSENRLLRSHQRSSCLPSLCERWPCPLQLGPRMPLWSQLEPVGKERVGVRDMDVAHLVPSGPSLPSCEQAALGVVSPWVVWDLWEFVSDMLGVVRSLSAPPQEPPVCVALFLGGDRPGLLLPQCTELGSSHIYGCVPWTIPDPVSSLSVTNE